MIYGDFFYQIQESFSDSEVTPCKLDLKMSRAHCGAAYFTGAILQESNFIKLSLNIVLSRDSHRNFQFQFNYKTTKNGYHLTLTHEKSTIMNI